jgi:SAM-dependent methyltransferase
MTQEATAFFKEQLTRLFGRDLTPAKPHAGFERVRKRYLDNGHKERIIESYSRILSQVTEHKTGLVVGADPLEGFLISRLAAHLSVQMIGSPETFTYRSPDEYEFGRGVNEQDTQEIFAVTRHNIESQTSFSNEAFDFIVCLEVIEHLRRDPLFALCEMRRLLRPGGTLFLSTPNMNSARAIRRALEWESPMFFPSFGPPPAGIVHAHEFSVREIVLLMGRAGFSIEDLSSFNHARPFSFDHDNHYRCGPSVADLPADISAATVQSMYQALSGQPMRGDYLFVTARGDGVPNSEPIHPVYCSFE